MHGGPPGSLPLTAHRRGTPIPIPEDKMAPVIHPADAPAKAAARSAVVSVGLLGPSSLP